MLQSLQAAILGIVQGLTEFLPVSSSAHLILVPWLMNWKDQGLAFDVALHLGTLLALLLFYWQQWLKMGASLFNDDRASKRLLMLLIIASVPGAIVGLLLEKQAETIFRSPILIAVTMSLMGVALWYFDKSQPQRRKLSQIGVFDALVIGLSQALAIIPGVSRSGSTITMARVMGISREDAANFSFMMATPIIAGAGLHESRQLLHDGISSDVIVGFVFAAIFGLIAISVLVRFVRARSYGVFAVYRLGLAAFVAAIWLMRS
ncbi:MAG TPA: undecaprenyl-diphosphate phosphatase [Candidatus Binataceae bacterium]|nr:undecaprenyl-diphosphate phosphatase [Candidatus Binataceae bacterium]